MALTDVAIQQFLDQFINEYQQVERKLAGSFQEYRNLIGDAFKIPIAGEVLMHDRGAFHSDIPPTIPAYSQSIITFSNKIALIPSDIFEQLEVNASERANYARAAAWSIARQEDQIGIDALTASTTTNTVAVGTTNLTVDKIRTAAKLLDEDNVPMMDRFWAAHVDQKESLLSETQTTSTDFNTQRTLVNGQLDTFYGFKFIWFGNLTEGGLPKTGDDRTNFAWQKNAIAYGYRKNPSVTVDWDSKSQSWLIIPSVSMGAKEVQADGIVKITCDETK